MRYFLIAFVSLFLVYSCSSQSSSKKGGTSSPYRDYIKSASLVPPQLDNIQSRIATALVDCFQQKNTEALDKIETTIENEVKDSYSLKSYWLAYINYYKTIVNMSLNNHEEGAKFNRHGIELLSNIQHKNSDDYALLIMHLGLSYQFEPGMKAPVIGKQIQKYIKDGMVIDPKNPRLLYVLGSNDLYTPKEFGGGKKAEGLFLKTLEYPDKNEGDSRLPTWGKEEAYVMLIGLYRKKGENDLAKKYLAELEEKYPSNYSIASLKKMVEN